MSFGIPQDGNDSDASMRMQADATEIRVAPFRIVVLDAFCGEATPPERGQPVTAASIDDAMAELGVRTTIAVTNHLTKPGKELLVRLRFASLRDLRPKPMLEQVPELRAGNALLSRLRSMRSGKLTAAQLQSDLEQADDLQALRGLDALAAPLNLALQRPTPGGRVTPKPPVAPPASDEQATGRKLLDELLDLDAPSTPTEATPPPKPTRSALDNVIGSITGGGKPSKQASIDKAAIDQAIEQIGKLLALQLQEILLADAVRTIERAWRGLQLLATQARGTDGQPVRIEVLHATANNFADVYRDSVHAPECAGESEHALSLAILGCALGNNTAQLQALRDTQQLAEELQAPLLWSMAADFLGEPIPELAQRDSVRALLDADDLAKWRGLRNDDAARWSGACYNPFVLRAPRTGDIDSWSFREPGDAILWGTPGYAVAAVIARSVIETGWPTRFTGTHAGGIDGRPLADQCPLVAPLGEATVEALADAGIMALTAPRGSDTITLLRAPSIHEAAQFGDRDEANRSSRLLSSLPYQLLVTRLAEITIRHKPSLVAAGEIGSLQTRFEAFLLAVIGDTGSGAAATVTVEADTKDRDTTWLHCAIRTGNQVLGGVDVEFTLRA